MALTGTGRDARPGRRARAAAWCWLPWFLLAGGALQAQDTPPVQTQTTPVAPAEQAVEPERPEISDDPTFLRTSLRGVLEQIHYSNGAVLERLRIRYLQALGKRDALIGDLPLGRVDPGAGFSSAYGTGDLSLQYAHLFVARRSSIIQAAGAIGLLKTASNEELGGRSGSLGALYAIAYKGSPRYEPYVVVQYLHSLREDTGIPTQSLFQVRPVLAFAIKRGWFGTGEFRALKQLDEPRDVGMTVQATVGRQIKHWRAVGGYERAINDTSEVVIYRSRAFFEFGYTF